ncbi:MAG: 8-oxo-dGTP diphosphatase [Pseudoalteromonas tetraodonis]|jgi:8-oxo-dGTP diphosphatase
MSYTYDYPRPSVTVDAALLSDDHVLLIKRKNSPFQNLWALPGGFLDENESPDDAVARELAEETSLTGVQLQPLGFWGKPDRDPRGHTISLAYCANVNRITVNPLAADDAADLAWFPLAELPGLAFDHAEIIAAAARSAPLSFS